MLLFLFWSAALLAQLSPGPLTTAHSHLEGTGNCTECHTFGKQVPESKCLNCHKELNSLIQQNRGYHTSKEVTGKLCIDCHSEHHGRKFEMIRFDEEAFNHDLTGYELEGTHNQVDCRECHQSKNIADREIRSREKTFLGLEEDCLSCHQDFHQKSLGNECVECHNFQKWRPAPGFNHNEAAFKLKGAHETVDCLECHKTTSRNGREYQEFTGIEFNQCIDCHEDVHNGSFGQNCLECHNQNSFDITGPLTSFNHDRTDFPLKGLHVQIDCRKCHKSNSYIQAVAHSQCKSCHSDYHKGEFKRNGQNPDCKVCHTVDNPFTLTLYGIDEHQESDFPLRGAHLATPCFACHLPKTGDRWTFRSIGSECATCHQDIHKGYIDSTYYPISNCTACHNEDSWSGVDFNHEKTGWPLEGAHRETDCRSCHFDETENSESFIQHFSDLSSDCANCHENIHGSQFSSDGEVVNCKKCHTVMENWTIDDFNHDSTQFPLDGQHSEVDCRECHKPRPDKNGVIRIEYKIKKFKCIDCHSS